MNEGERQKIHQHLRPVFKLFKHLLSFSIEELKFLEFDPLPLEDLVEICHYSRDIFSKESTLLNLEGEFRVIGDLHGHLPDLIRIFKKCGQPSKHKYLFLGDFVDRGHFSVETAMILFSLKVEYPNTIYILRGNHEFEAICKKSGLYEEIQKLYGNDYLYESMIETFSYLPLGAVLNNDILCVHGGISPELETLDRFDTIARPLNQLYGGICDDILWSDPNPKVTGFQPSNRGNGVTFGEDVLKKFLKSNNLRLLIRGHSFLKEGIQCLFKNKVITVFSASNYCGIHNNKGGCLIIKKQKEEYIQFDPIYDIKRNFDKIDLKKNNRFYAKLPKVNSYQPCMLSPILSKVNIKTRHVKSTKIVLK